MQVAIRLFQPGDRDEFYAAFEEIVNDREGFPHDPPLTPNGFDDYWFGPATTVWTVRIGSELAGGYYLKPNFVGRAAHIANGGYFVRRPHRGGGVGRRMVEHSLGAARQLGYDALQFNLVFASNPARRMYRQLGFQEIGVVPGAVDGEDAVIYWRALGPEQA